METLMKKSNLLIIGAGCTLLLILACVMSTLLAGGGLLLRKLSSEKSQAQSFEQSPTETQKPASEEDLSESKAPKLAILQDLRGFVEVQSAVGDWSPAVEGQSVSQGQHVRTGELSEVVLAFSDGSRATLKTGSEIAIDRLDAKEPPNPRVIILTQISGESSHDVAPNHAEGAQYLVNSPSGKGEAKGTTFTVVVTPEKVAYYTVITGIVAVTGMDVTVLVNAGEFTILLFEQPPLTPVMSVSGEGVLTQVGETWTIAEQIFVVNESTIISGDPQPGDWVHVQGHLASDGLKIADWIYLLHASPANRFSITGVVEAFGEGVWTINSQPVLVTDTTEYDDMVQVGDLVRVNGVVLEDGKLQASAIELVNPTPGLPFSFSGVVQETGANIWLISGISVLINEDTGLDESLVAGALVRVIGWIQEDGKWLAKSIVLITDDNRRFVFTGTLQQTNPWKVAGIAFEVREWTLVDEDLKTGMLVRVEGEINAEGIWVAGKVERLDDDQVSTLVLVGTVVSVDPWVISGIPLTITDSTQIIGQVTVGTLVRVVITLGPGGVWQVVSIQALDLVAWFPGCMDVVATVVSVSENQIQLLNWPAVVLADGVQVEGGEIIPNSIVRFRMCFTEARIIQIVYIIIVQPGEIEVEVPDNSGGSVTICHKPGKKGGGKTMTIPASALGGHLGHGDYQGACR